MDLVENPFFAASRRKKMGFKKEFGEILKRFAQSLQSIDFYFIVSKIRKGKLMISTRNLYSNRKDCRRDLCDRPWLRSCGAFEHHPVPEEKRVPTSELCVSRDEGNMQKVC